MKRIRGNFELSEIFVHSTLKKSVSYNDLPLQSSNRRHRRDLDVDDMIDSTVDSTGFSSVNLNQQRSSNNDSNEGMIKN